MNMKTKTQAEMQQQHVVSDYQGYSEITFFDSEAETGALWVSVNGQNMTVDRFRKIRGVLKIKRFDYRNKEKKRPG